MTLQYPGQRKLKALVRRNDHDARVVVLLRLGPKAVYGGLLWIRDQRGYRRGWEKHAFRELYGTEPRPQDKGEPLRPPVALEEWVNARPKKKKRRSASVSERAEP
jgi:hypothetical protein